MIEKIAALSSRDHGDARQAVALLAKSAYLAEKAGSRITLKLVDEAAAQIEQDRYVTMIRTSPPQLQAAMTAVIQAAAANEGRPVSSGCAYDAYKPFCIKAGIRPHMARAFGDLLTELGMYSFVRCNVLSRGRYGRTRQITLNLPEELAGKIQDTILLNFELR